MGLLCVAAQAQSPPTPASQAPADSAGSWTGYAGVGAFGHSRYVGGKSNSATPAPILSFEYKGIAYVDILRAGVRFWGSEDKKMAFGLAAEPRFGFKSSDGARLTSMGERKLSIEAGPSFEWETPIVSVNLAYLTDITGKSRGGSWRGQAYKQLVNNTQWDFGPYAGFERIDGKISNYYFGVRDAEAVAGRPAYQAGATTNWTLGVSGAYKFNSRYALMFGYQSTFLGSAAGNSPIVETRNAKLGWLGLAFIL